MREYSHLREDALDRTMCRARFGRDFGPVVRQTINWMKIIIKNYQGLFMHNRNEKINDLEGSITHVTLVCEVL